MKKNYFFLVALFLSIQLCSAQIPNFSFENWTNMGTYSNPDQWGTLNNTTDAAGVYTATQGTPGSPGNYFLKLTSKLVNGDVVNGIAVSGVLDSIGWAPVSGFPFTARPASFTGKWQHMIFGTTQGSVSVTLTRWDAQQNQRVNVATATTKLTGMAMNWTAFSINFAYTDGNNPDSCIIFLQASGNIPTDQDYLWVDNLGFTGSVTGINTVSVTDNIIQVYPNPAHLFLTIAFNEEYSQQHTIEISTESGQLVLCKETGIVSGNSTIEIPVAALSKGNYFVKIITGNNSEIKKITLQ